MDPESIRPPEGTRTRTTLSFRPPGRAWWLVAVGVAVVLTAGAVTAGFTIGASTGGAGGVHDGSSFLTDWQQNAVLSSVTPNPAPTAASTAVAAPTRLAGASGAFALDPAVAGDLSVEWTFTEATGMPPSQEIELSFGVQYVIGGVSHDVTGTVYLESQAAAIPAALTFDFYWDAGVTVGATFAIESQISQACGAVGTCP